MLRELCGSAERYRMLRALFEHPDRELPLRRLASAAEVDPGNASKLLKRLEHSGLCERIGIGRNCKFRAPRNNALFEPLRALFAAAAADQPGGHISASGHHDDQEQREIGEALMLQRLPAAQRGQRLTESFDQLQTRANAILGNTPVSPGTFHFANQDEKNRRDETLEIERAALRARNRP